MEIKKKTLARTVAVIVLILFGVISAYAISGGQKQDQITGNVAITGEYQSVTLKFENYEYVLEPSTLKKGIPVRMEVELDSVYGCMRDIVIKEFNVRKYVREGDNIIEFLPNKAGTIGIACSMNMGRGKFLVVE